MARADVAPAASAVESDALGNPGMTDRIQQWVAEEGPWWLCSFVLHMVLICGLAMITMKAAEQISGGDQPSFDSTKEEEKNKEPPPEISEFVLGDPIVDPTELTTESLTADQPGQIAQEEEINDSNPVFEHKGGGMKDVVDSQLSGLGGLNIRASGSGPAVRGGGGPGSGAGFGNNPGSGGDGWGFGGRGSGMRKAMLASGGGTKATERAVAGALNWLARHQMADGSWSLEDYSKRCKAGDATCREGAGGTKSDTAATAMGLLPFFAAGQTHLSKGPYQNTIRNGIYWLKANQKADGDLRSGGGRMYAHGLASIALCEAYAMSGDQDVGRSAQAAIDFIQKAQNTTTGGWRYTPGEEGDTSVVGWMIMALKSAQMSYLKVNPEVLERAKKFLNPVQVGGGDSTSGSGKFGYVPGSGPSTTMSAVGLLCNQYMGVPREDPTIVGGTQYLMQHQVGDGARDIYYWYYATQVLHNQPGPEWDAWNRKMRKYMVESQVRGGCAEGSWDPKKPTIDHWGSNGGRVMETSLGALTLEVYYRYLPLYKLDKPGEAAKPGDKPADKPAEKAAEKPAAKA